MRPTLLLAPFVLIACAQPEMAEPEDLSAGQPCDPTILEEYVGREATQDVAAEMMELAGSRSMRWINPDSAVTMDYRPDRLNIYLDGEGKIERANCG